MEANNIKMNMDGTIRAKVLQYKSDGNTLTEKWHNITKFAEGIYFSYTTPDRYGHRSVNVIFSKNGIFWRAGGEPEHYFNPESFRYAEHMETLKKRYANYEADIMQAVVNGSWLNKLHITVMGRLGYDTTAMVKAYNERRRKMEELDRQRAEEAERRERERKEAEERRKADVLADGKEKLLKHERITVEQIELIAEAVGYKIHIRTIGFMREKVTEVVLCEDDTVTVWGRKLTSRNIDGTAKVMHELYDRLKAQVEEEARQPATPAEAPRISTETAETVNVSVEGENAAERANVGQNYSDARVVEDEYYHRYKVTRRWINGRIDSIDVVDLNCTPEPPQSPENRPTAADVAQMVKTELAKNKAMRTTWKLEFPGGTECDVRYKNTVAGCDFYDYSERNGKIERFRDYPAVVSDITLYICQALGIDALEPPQSPEAPQRVECTAEPCKLAQTA